MEVNCTDSESSCKLNELLGLVQQVEKNNNAELNCAVNASNVPVRTAKPEVEKKKKAVKNVDTRTAH